jgi:hypothetical protein
MMRPGLVVCLVAAGCSFRSPVVGGDTPDGSHGGSDRPCQTFSHQLDTCMLADGDAAAALVVS